MSVPSVVVVTNPHRPPLVLDALAGIEHEVSCTRDYELPAGFTTAVTLARYNQVGAYRCFRGHQDAMALGSRDPVLVLEDDAVPNSPDWWQVVRSAAALLCQVDVVSLHGRGFDRSRFDQRGTVSGRELLVPRFRAGPVKVFGSLAYLIGGTAKQRFMAMRYDGVPVDLLLPNRFRFSLVDPSPFDHDRRYPSLVG